mmetsp:Transcript_63259/g.74804  ORF Transcript_63259/g.74804 Transcript_63259/m.74804 type:complete len:450 (+) Transcript_63259:35-1384(+)|eukprot:CAMPEP_0172496620 /NCGR_PEP_ID=MMETSP1066-20121228/90247_1 /TAXON_ID=671091 /ORGANISM="Coscinodiscus wailesii, Strain CCMP2513" /LENGTH=449 /DNA_ID=CAMNT_0013269001 /DNA_START=24 /DNA_END=1373 /DNA_ORIENTATION=+
MQILSQGNSDDEPATVVIAGAGLAGLTLALALNKHVGIDVEIYEQSKSLEFHDGIGAGMGMYPNGLRVIRDICPQLLERIQQEGHPYLFRRWERHDGTEVAIADESTLSEANLQSNLQPMGIRRWRLQKQLFDAVQAQGIPIFFGKKVSGVDHSSSDIVTLNFGDGSYRDTRLLFAADGSNSIIRNVVAGHLTGLSYTGTTCFYGVAPSVVGKDKRGICLPSSETSKCHGCFYPVSPTEVCFQIHMPAEPGSSEDGPVDWTTLSGRASEAECKALADELLKDEWHDRYLLPINNAQHAIKVPFAVLEPRLKKFVFNRIVLLGDAAHPNVPYLGQVAQIGFEDAGVLALLMKDMCLDVDGNFSLEKIDSVLEIYNRMRVPRAFAILQNSKNMGRTQQRRAEHKRYNEMKEQSIQRDVFFHSTIPVLYEGPTYDYKEEVINALHGPKARSN